MKCGGQLNLSKCGKLIKTLMDKLILNCEKCNKETSLYNYQNHIDKCSANIQPCYINLMESSHIKDSNYLYYLFS